MLEKNNINFKFISKKDESSFFSKINKDDLTDILKQQPNGGFLRKGKFYLKIYSYGNKKDNKFRNWLKRVGEKPVILDTSLARKSREQMVLFLRKNGYFDAFGSEKVRYKSRINWTKRKLKKNSAFVSYYLTPKKPWEVKKISYSFNDDSLKDDIINYSKTLSIKRGSNFNEYKIAKEREQMVRFMKNNGYYDFNKKHIDFKVDTHLNEHKVNYQINVKNQISNNSNDTVTESTHQKYHIKKIIITSSKKLNNHKLDTMEYSGYSFLNYHGNTIKPKVIARSVFIQKGDLYDLSKVEYTYKRLTELGVFNSISITISKESEESDDKNLIVLIQLKFSPKYSTTFETEGTNRGGNLGVNSRINFINKNSFKGAEILRIGVFGGLEAQKTNNNLFEDKTKQINQALPFNTLEYGGDITLKLPYLLLPRKKNELPTYVKPSTEISTAYNYQYRGSFDRDIFNISYRYKWFFSRKHGFNYSPLDLSFVRLDKDSAFEKRLDATKNSLLINSYQNHLIAASNLEYTFTNQTTIEKNYVFFKSNIESAGNLLHEYDKLVNSSKEINGNYYEKFGIRYAQYIKFDADIRLHNTLTYNSKIVYRLYGGIGVPLTNLNVLPFEKSFFGGGANTNRAWVARTLGPGGLPGIDSLNTIDRIGDINIEGNIEYRFNIINRLKGALFIDMGNVWIRKKDSLRPNAEFNINRFYKEIAVGVGTGLRIDLDFFIIRGDVGFKAHNPSLPEKERWFWQSKTTFEEWNNRKYKSRLNFNLGIGYPF